jgi:hypothetical protein
MRSHEEIQAEIEGLKALRPRLKPTTAFGDSNLDALDAQVRVLEEDMTHDEIWDEWPELDGDMHVRSSAEEARQWLEGELETETLVETWEGVTV